MPLDSWTEAEAEVFFWALGQYLGVPGAQDNDGALLGHVRDQRADPRTSRQYKTNSSLALHCDAADVVGLLCLHPSRTGGVSRLVSSVTVYNELLQTAEGQAHAARLFRPVALDTRDSGKIDYLRLPPLRYADGVLRTFWHAEYLRSSARHARHGPLDAATAAALDAYDAITQRPELQLDMALERGDIQLLSNHFVLHARTAYTDEPGQPQRHLLRLWLTAEDTPGLRLWALRLLDGLGVARAFLAAKLGLN